MKILVTGASGFVGSRTCSHLEAAGHDVIRISHSKKSGLPREFVLDITDPGSFATLDEIGEIDAIVQCAGIAHRFGRTSRDEFWKVNVDGTKNVVDFAARKQVTRFIHLSSVLVYGPSTSNQPVTEDQTPAPKDDYSSSKLAGEIAVASVCETEGIELVVLRPAPIIGEESRGNVARLIHAIDRKRFVWIGDGRNERSFVDVSDVAEAILTGLSTPDSFATFNVTGGTMTVREMVTDISDQLGKPHQARLIPYKAAKLAMSASRPLAKLPRIGSYHRTLETWLSDAVYSGQALMNAGFIPKMNVRKSLRNEVKAYLASKQ